MTRLQLSFLTFQKFLSELSLFVVINKILYYTIGITWSFPYQKFNPIGPSLTVFAFSDLSSWVWNPCTCLQCYAWVISKVCGLNCAKMVRYGPLSSIGQSLYTFFFFSVYFPDVWKASDQLFSVRVRNRKFQTNINLVIVYWKSRLKKFLRFRVKKIHKITIFRKI